MPEEVQYTTGDTSSKHQVNNVQLQYTVKRAYCTYLLILGQFSFIGKAWKLRFLINYNKHFEEELYSFLYYFWVFSVLQWSCTLPLAVQCLFMWAWERNLSFWPGTALFSLSSRVKALRHSLGEASTIWIAKKTENPLQAQSELYDNT